jgi:hypothetical protein
MKENSSNKLGPLDNTSKNTNLTPQNYLNDNLINPKNSTSPKESTKTHQTHQPLHEKNPLITNNIHDCTSHFFWIYGQIGSFDMNIKQKRKWRQKWRQKLSGSIIGSY